MIKKLFRLVISQSHKKALKSSANPSKSRAQRKKKKNVERGQQKMTLLKLHKNTKKDPITSLKLKQDEKEILSLRPQFSLNI